MKPLYHPNALPPHLREQLPDPTRPITEPVVPATAMLFDDRFDPLYQALAKNFTAQPQALTNPFPTNPTVENVLTFLQHHQTQMPQTGLGLADFVKTVRPLGQAIIHHVLSNNPDFYPNSAETRLLMTAQFWQNLLAVYLMAQCKTRKTLNPEISLQTLSQQMNAYLAEHQREVEFLTFHSSLTLSADHVAFAILALGGKLSIKGKLGERVTNISSHHFLSNFKSS